MVHAPIVNRKELIYTALIHSDEYHFADKHAAINLLCYRWRSSFTQIYLTCMPYF